jgi:WD40 repeat protein
VITTSATTSGNTVTPPASVSSQTTAALSSIPLGGFSGLLNSLSWSSDGRFYITASDDKTLKIWDAATNKVVQTLDDKANPILDRVLSAVFSPDGQYVVASLADKSIRFYSVKNGVVLITAKGDLIAPAVISPDQALIPYSGAKTIRTWDYKKDNNGPEFPYFDSNAPGLAPTALAFSPDSATLAVGLNNGRIILFKVATGQPLVVVEPPPNVKNSVRLLAWSPGGNLLVVGREKSFETLSIDFKNGLASPTALGMALSAPASSLSFSADGKRLAVSSQNGEIQLWSLDNNQMINRIITGSNPIIGLRWSQDNQQITAATGGSNPALNIYATQPVQRSLKVALVPRNGTKVTGNAQLTELPGGLVRVTLNVEGLQPGQHNVHIHAGSCANQGDIKFNLETLRATADGKAASTTVIKVDYTALTTGSFYVNVHNDPGTDTYIASCGEIHV